MNKGAIKGVRLVPEHRVFSSFDAAIIGPDSTNQIAPTMMHAKRARAVCERAFFHSLNGESVLTDIFVPSETKRSFVSDDVDPLVS